MLQVFFFLPSFYVLNMEHVLIINTISQNMTWRTMLYLAQNHNDIFLYIKYFSWINNIQTTRIISINLQLSENWLFSLCSLSHARCHKIFTLQIQSIDFTLKVRREFERFQLEQNLIEISIAGDIFQFRKLTIWSRPSWFVCSSE